MNKKLSSSEITAIALLLIAALAFHDSIKMILVAIGIVAIPLSAFIYVVRWWRS